MFVPLWLGVPALIIVLVIVAWCALILAGRNPLPFPDVGSRIFSAASPAAKATPDPAVVQRLGSATASIGLVADDPAAAAHAAAAFLTARGFSAEVVLDVEPGLPIAFVVSNAFAGTVLNFRKHLIHMPRPPKAAA